MSKILLIHGAWHASWCWYKLTPILEASGYNVIAPDLPGHDKSGHVSLPVFNDYVESVTRLIKSEQEPVILLGHSMAGAIISQVAETVPHQISRLIYLSAYLLNNEESILGVTKADTDGKILGNLVYSNDMKSASINPVSLKNIFYNDCNYEDFEYAATRVNEQSLEPLAAPVQVSREKWGRVERHYIKCEFDNTVSISCQEKMLENNPCKTVEMMETGHSPFISAPGPLAKLIHKICQY